MKLATEFSSQEIARMKRAANFRLCDFDEWIRQSLFSSLRCDEEDMIFDDAGNIIGDGREIFHLALEAEDLARAMESEE